MNQPPHDPNDWYREGPIHPQCQHDSCRRIKTARTATGRLVETYTPGTSSDQRMIGWLRDNLQAIRQDETAGQLADTIHWLRETIEIAIDNAEPLIYCDRCDAPDTRTEIIDGTIYVAPSTCGAELMATQGAEYVECQACGWTYRVDERRARMLEQMRDRLMRPAEIVDVLRAYGVNITLDRLKLWISRDKARFDNQEPPGPRRPPPILMRSATVLDEHGEPIMEADGDRVDRYGQTIMRLAQGKPVYRLGDVQDRIEWLKVAESQRTKETA